MASLNFKDALDTNLADVEKPPLPPVGTYEFQIVKVPELQEDVSDGQWDIVNFQVQAVRATEDVDPTAMNEFGQPKNINLRHSFLFDKQDETAFKRTEWNLRRFLEEHLGLPANQSFKASFAQAQNKRFLAYVFWKPRKNEPETFDAAIRNTAPVA